MENFITELINFIPANLVIVVIAAYCLGLLLKKVNFIKDECIPLILPVFAIIFSLIIAGITPLNFLYGVIGATVAVYGDNVLRQVKKINKDGEV